MKKSLVSTWLILSTLLCFTITSHATSQPGESVNDAVAVEEAVTEKVVAEEAAAEKVLTEEVDTEAVAAEKVLAEKVAAEEAVLEEPVTEKVDAEAADAEESVTEKVDTEAIVIKKPHEKGEPTKKAGSSEFSEKYIKGHLQIGTNSLYRNLTDSDSGHRGGTYGSGTFLGTIYGLDESQNLAPLELKVSYFFNKYIGLQIGYDKIEAETLAWDHNNNTSKTDGDVSIAGPTLSIVARIPNSTPVTPFVGVGLDFYSASFDATSTWTNSPRYNGQAYNVMEVEDVTGHHFMIGAEWAFAKNWAVDITFKYTQADVDATYYGYYKGELYTTQEGHFPLDNTAFGVGLSYHF